jgi:hypothetical protein
MNKTPSTRYLMTAALLAGALALPGLALAHGGGWEGRDGDRHGHRDWHDEGYRGHWRGHGHDHWRHDREVVVQEPVYLAPPPTVVAPLWQPGLGINLYLPLIR